jgi:hypothetical protein
LTRARSLCGPAKKPRPGDGTEDTVMDAPFHYLLRAISSSRYFRVMLRNRAIRLRREMEIKEFRVACGEFAGFGDMSRTEWERPGRALVPDGVPWASGMFAVRAHGGSMNLRSKIECGAYFIRMWLASRQHNWPPLVSCTPTPSAARSPNSSISMPRSEDELYAAMDWLLPQQARIEQTLAKRHLAEGAMVLYDLTSTYFEGRHCPLGQLGYPRDGNRPNSAAGNFSGSVKTD